jgi:mRNA interferase RelE/StbE
LEKIRGLAADPRSPGIEKMTDRRDLYRARAGDHRIVFSIEDNERIVTVETIGNRRDVYRE